MCINIGIIVNDAKNARIDHVILTFDLSTPNHIISRISQGIHYTKFEHFGIIRFWVILRVDKQTNKQTEANILTTPTDSVNVSNNIPQNTTGMNATVK